LTLSFTVLDAAIMDTIGRCKR